MSQIFQFSFPVERFFDFLEKYCTQNKNQLIFSKDAFKRAKLDEAIKPFCEDLKKYYFSSKYFYLERDMIYKNFVTIVRQICKYHHIPFTSSIKYNKSNYDIYYFIYREIKS